jgi:hypothetical protein
MTALAGRDVKRIFSAVGANFAGLPRHGTHEAGCQQFGQFGKAFIRGTLTCRGSAHAHKVNQKLQKSSGAKRVPNSSEHRRTRSKTKEKKDCAKRGGCGSDSVGK